MVHRLKTSAESMIDIATGKKSFEVRLDDRGFDEGHVLLLEGWDNNEKKYTERTIEAEVTYIIYGGHFGIEEGYVVMGIKVRNYNF
jgi:hypothetical protein